MKSHEELIKGASRNYKVYPKGTKFPYLSKVGEVSAHKLGRLVDGPHAGAPSLLQTLLEVRLGRVVKDEPGPPSRSSRSG